MNLSSELSHYGVNPRSKSVRWFRDNATPELIDYLDLIEPRGPAGADQLMPDGVAENQERPLLYFVNESRLAQAPEDGRRQVSNLRRTLACRGDRAYLAIVRPGTLDVAPVSLQDQTTDWITYRAGSEKALTFFPRLALGRCEDVPSGPEVDFLFKEMFQLVEKTASRLEQLKVKRTDVLSLVGRTLFFRFLKDRSIITDRYLKKISPGAASLEQCFDNAENAAATSNWLDRTFNGDFLPLTDGGSLEFFQSLTQRLGQRVFGHLGGIARGDEPSGDDGFQLRLPIHWGHLDFAHIPVGLLSQVYEKLSWKWDHAAARSTSVHYTPRHIAATLVGEAFDNLPNAYEARVLDPACGASMFLVIAFRRLYRELWNKTPDKRPDTAAIRNILENQLVGFDISDSALKLSALSLYLTAIELDPDPVPPEKLKFKAMRSGRHTMLFDWRRDTDKADGPVAGSIGNHVGKRFDRSFELVLCNPPWTNIAAEFKAVSAELDEASKAIVTRLDSTIGRDYQNPDSVPDLPFLWKSMEWCKEDGRIAMALPARTLFKQGPLAEKTRKAIFSLLEVTGIINASNLRKTKVWPEMDQPFMLLFARNRRPKPHHRLHFISPHTDFHANSLGEMRIDAKSAQFVDVEETIEIPWLWKALAVGTALDVEVVRKLKDAGGKPLKEYWEKELGLICRNGYQVRPDQKIRQDSRQMKVLKDFTSTDQFHFVVDTSQLDYFTHDMVGWSRINYDEGAQDPLRAYRGPLTLIKESPGVDRTQGWAYYCSDDVAFNESFYGYSAHGHPHGEPAGIALAKYLHLFIHSRIWIFYALLTSAKLGIERPNVEKKDIDKFPFLPITTADGKTIEDLSNRLLDEDTTVFSDIDTFFGKLYGLSSFDLEVIADTLEVREPNDELGTRASKIPSVPEQTAFLRRVKSILRPLFKALGKQPEVRAWKTSDDFDSPFVVFTLSSEGEPVPDPSGIFTTSVLPLANETGATRIIKRTDGGLIIGILRQYRYWTPTRARMLCADIIRGHLTIFED
ncbi:MAG TPA: N-6 DNA methylase [Verrucomicrobiales bacterium]|nr:N-6 DNA methylase [Verrucomicrobiales bacterium]